MRNLKENSVLANLIVNDNMTTEDVTKLLEHMRKKDAVKEIVDISKIKEREDIKQFYVYIKRKQYTGRSYNELVNKLYKEFCMDETLATLYPKMMIYKRDECKSSAKTLKEYTFRWNNLKTLSIITKPIKDITSKEYKTAFRKLVVTKNLTESAFRDHKSVVNAILAYAIEQDVIQFNPIRDIDFNSFPFAIADNDSKYLNAEQRQKLLGYLSTIDDDIYALAIRFDLYITSRIAEIKSLKWEDIADGYIRIKRQLVEHQLMNDKLEFAPVEKTELLHVKGRKRQGFRYIPLSPKVQEILEQAKQLNPNGKYIFMQESRPLTTTTFNRHLEKYCKACKLPVISSHGIRFTVASCLYAEGMSKPELQELLGHTNLNTTDRYIKNTVDIKKTASKMCAIL